MLGFQGGQQKAMLGKGGQRLSAMPQHGGNLLMPPVPRSIPIKAKIFGSVNKNIMLDIATGTSVSGLKKMITMKFPDVTIQRILFSGMPWKDDSRTLASLGVYKECTVQVMVRKLPESEPRPDVDKLRREMGCVLYAVCVWVFLIHAS